jgi:hypothetical protein
VLNICLVQPAAITYPTVVITKKLNIQYILRANNPYHDRGVSLSLCRVHLYILRCVHSQNILLNRVALELFLIIQSVQILIIVYASLRRKTSSNNAYFKPYFLSLILGFLFKNLSTKYQYRAAIHNNIIEILRF